MSVKGKILSSYYQLDDESAKRVKFLCGRGALLERMPKNSVCAEMGVARGNFSNAILKIVQPRVLHLIDPWENNFPNAFLYKISDKRHYSNYRCVIKRFATEMMQGKVVVHREKSYDIVGSFPYDYFDWIYLDSDHMYGSTMQELKMYSKKMKHKGYICGHDYGPHVLEAMKCGVHRAVTEFCRDFGWGMRYLAFQATNCTFCIQKK